MFYKISRVNKRRRENEGIEKGKKEVDYNKSAHNHSYYFFFCLVAVQMCLNMQSQNQKKHRENRR